MKVKELVEMFSKMDPEADIVMYNSTTRHWCKTDAAVNYTPKTIEEIYPNLGNYAKKQMDKFDKNSVTFYF